MWKKLPCGKKQYIATEQDNIFNQLKWCECTCISIEKNKCNHYNQLKLLVDKDLHKYDTVGQKVNYRVSLIIGILSCYRQNISKISGYFGMILLILSYILLNFSVIDILSYTYQISNLVAAILLIISAWENKPIVILNIFWSGVALIQIIKLLVG